MSQYCLEVDGIPPSVNCYVRHTRSGRHYKTAEAEAFEQKVALAASTRNLRDKKLDARTVEILIVLGPKQRGDVDNFCKSSLDPLVRCGVIQTDASITRLVIEKIRGDSPRTRIWITTV